MSNHNDTEVVLRQIADDGEDIRQIYHDMIGFIQYQVTEKGIEFDGYFMTKWKFEAEHPFTFDAQYFENQERCELYVYLAALVDEEVYSWVEFAFNLTHKETLTENVLHREIYNIQETGLKL